MAAHVYQRPHYSFTSKRRPAVKKTFGTDFPFFFQKNLFSKVDCKPDRAVKGETEKKTKRYTRKKKIVVENKKTSGRQSARITTRAISFDRSIEKMLVFFMAFFPIAILFWHVVPLLPYGLV